MGESTSRETAIAAMARADWDRVRDVAQRYTGHSVEWEGADPAEREAMLDAAGRAYDALIQSARVIPIEEHEAVVAENRTLRAIADDFRAFLAALYEPDEPADTQHPSTPEEKSKTVTMTVRRDSGRVDTYEVRREPPHPSTPGGTEPCPECHGKGSIYPRPRTVLAERMTPAPLKCSACNGSGRVTPGGDEPAETRQTCPRCKGSGVDPSPEPLHPGVYMSCRMVGCEHGTIRVPTPSESTTEEKA